MPVIILAACKFLTLLHVAALLLQLLQTTPGLGSSIPVRQQTYPAQNLPARFIL
jgi:hypothetical protein